MLSPVVTVVFHGAPASSAAASAAGGIAGSVHSDRVVFRHDLSFPDVAGRTVSSSPARAAPPAATVQNR